MSGRCLTDRGGADQRYRQAKQALEEHLRHYDWEECALFQSLMAKVLVDKGLQEMSGLEDVEAFLWQELGEATPFRKKGNKGSLNRFMSVIREARGLDRDWRSQLYGWILTCVELDFFKGKKFLELLSTLNLGSLMSRDVDDGRRAMNQPSAAEKAVKVAGCNALVSGVVFLM